MKVRYKLLQNYELCTNGKVHIMNISDGENVDFIYF